jgi:uncharacterized protein (TIGR02594 family)
MTGEEETVHRSCPSAGETGPNDPKAIEEDGADDEEVDEASDDGDDDGRDDEPSRNKPWWAIVLVAALASVGTTIATSALKLVGREIDSIRSWPIHFDFFVRNKSGGALKGVDVVLHSADGRKVIASGKTNEYGALDTEVSLRHGAYLLEVRYKLAEKEYATTEQIPISQPTYLKNLKFDPAEWEEVTALASNATSSTTASGDLSSELPQVTLGPPWLGTAYRELGQHEYPSPHVNPRIVEYWRSIPGFPSRDDPQGGDWASAFVTWVLNQNGITGTNSAMSRSWLNWGKAVETPTPGCIAVFWTQSPTSPAGHVGFFIHSDANSVTVLGGDSVVSVPDSGLQHRVALMRLRRATFLGCREP